MVKKKKKIRQLGQENLFATFGVQPKRKPSFTEELENNLAEQDMRAVLTEKGGPRKIISARQRLKLYPPPQDELDLHGLTGPEAERATIHFLRATTSLRLRTIRIITGKGLHSDGPAVLPDIVECKLEELKAEQEILGYAWEHKTKHKSGAVLVYLP